VSHPNNTAAKQEETTHYETKAPPNLDSLSAKKPERGGPGDSQVHWVLPSSTKISISRKHKRRTKTKKKELQQHQQHL
jgi:hypothetical protein